MKWVENGWSGERVTGIVHHTMQMQGACLRAGTWVSGVRRGCLSCHAGRWWLRGATITRHTNTDGWMLPQTSGCMEQHLRGQDLTQRARSGDTPSEGYAEWEHWGAGEHRRCTCLSRGCNSRAARHGCQTYRYLTGCRIQCRIQGSTEQLWAGATSANQLS